MLLLFVFLCHSPVIGATLSHTGRQGLINANANLYYSWAREVKTLIRFRSITLQINKS